MLRELARLLPEFGAPAGPEATNETKPEPQRLGLTAREFEVLRLVAGGRSNREIATRGEAAAAHRLRLFDSPQP